MGGEGREVAWEGDRGRRRGVDEDRGAIGILWETGAPSQRRSKTARFRTYPGYAAATQPRMAPFEGMRDTRFRTVPLFESRSTLTTFLGEREDRIRQPCPAWQAVRGYRQLSFRSQLGKLSKRLQGSYSGDPILRLRDEIWT